MIQNRQYRIIPTFKMIVEKRFPFGLVITGIIFWAINF